MIFNVISITFLTVLEVAEIIKFRPLQKKLIALHDFHPHHVRKYCNNSTIHDDILAVHYRRGYKLCLNPIRLKKSPASVELTQGEVDIEVVEAGEGGREVGRRWLHS